ncbi:MAG: hypothetical protein FRX49_08943 [Trebouxia sp. A1-2]|nr:MAG: hypothetical protein FRX49_08943 [Trebouxia sp. A1-2]
MEGPGRLRRPGVWVALAPLSLKRMMKGTLSIPPFNHWPEGRHGVAKPLFLSCLAGDRYGNVLPPAGSNILSSLRPPALKLLKQLKDAT